MGFLDKLKDLTDTARGKVADLERVHGNMIKKSIGKAGQDLEARGSGSDGITTRGYRAQEAVGHRDAAGGARGDSDAPS